MNESVEFNNRFTSSVQLENATVFYIKRGGGRVTYRI